MAQTTRARIDAAVSRALEAKLPIIKVDRDYYAVGSSSRPNEGYLLEIDDTGSIWCPCPGFEHTGLCVHKMSLGLHLGRVPASWLPTPTGGIDMQVAS
jgi:hypothetical protein